MRTVVLVLLLAGAISAVPVTEQQLNETWIQEVIEVIEAIENLNYTITPIGSEKIELAENLVKETAKVLQLSAPALINLIKDLFPEIEKVIEQLLAPLIQDLTEGKRELEEEWYDLILKFIDFISPFVGPLIQSLTGGKRDVEDNFLEDFQKFQVFISDLIKGSASLGNDVVSLIKGSIATAGTREVEDNLIEDFQKFKVFISDLIEGSATTAVTREVAEDWADIIYAVFTQIIPYIVPVITKVISVLSK